VIQLRLWAQYEVLPTVNTSVLSNSYKNLAIKLSSLATKFTVGLGKSFRDFVL